MSKGLSSSISSSVSSSGNSSTRMTTGPRKTFSSSGIVAGAGVASASRSANEGGVPSGGVTLDGSLRRHAERTVEPDRLAVEHGVVDDVKRELGVFVRRTEAAGEGDAG